MKVPVPGGGNNEEDQVRKTYALILSALISLPGCGSSSSSSGPSYTSGSTYETNPPIAVSTIAGTAGLVGSTDATGTSARFGKPNGVIVSPDGTTLYVSDFGNNTIRRMDLSTGAVTTIAGSAGAPGTTDGSGSTARFNGPHFITTDGNNLYVTDFNNNSIRKIVIATGEVTTLAGSMAGIAGGVDGAGTASRFNGPSGITITPDGTTLYVADYYNQTIRKIVIATGAVTTMVTSAGFSYPAGIICDGTGTNLYVTDFNANTIFKIIISSGVVSTLAGSTGGYGSADRTGSEASFYNPNGITVLGTNLYVADFTNQIVRKIVISTGVVTTVAGSAGVAGSADGSGAAAGFSFPIGITTDGTNLYVGDAYNRIIRKIQ
jgi:DNA-binding beta-propeller fold protein YncE